MVPTSVPPPMLAIVKLRSAEALIPTVPKSRVSGPIQRMGVSSPGFVSSVQPCPATIRSETTAQARRSNPKGPGTRLPRIVFLDSHPDVFRGRRSTAGGYHTILVTASPNGYPLGVQLERNDIPPFLVGIASIPAQAILLRELLARGAGNELSLTLDLALWLGGSALGARLWGRAGRRGHPPFAPLLLLGLVIVIAALAAGRFAPLPGVVPGEVPGPLAILTLGALVLFLPAFFTAGLFPLAAGFSRSAGRAYVAEAVGALVGGLGTTLLLVARVDALTILALTGVVVVSGVVRARARWIVAGLFLLGIVSGGTSRLDDILFARAWEAQHPGLELLRHAATPTRVLTLSEREGEQWLMADGSPREVISDPYRDHRIAALLLAVAPRVESVLLIDFGAASVAPVLAKAGVERVVCLLAEREDTLLVPPAPGVVCVIGDPRRSLRNVQDSWDVIALSGGEAVTVGSNRFWTAEAFESMSARLDTAGVVVAIAPGGQASAGPEAQAWRAAVASAMKDAIGPVRTIDADNFVFVSSARSGDATLDPDTLALRYERAGRSLPTYPSVRFAVEFPRRRRIAICGPPPLRTPLPDGLGVPVCRRDLPSSCRYWSLSWGCFSFSCPSCSAGVGAGTGRSFLLPPVRPRWASICSCS